MKRVLVANRGEIAVRVIKACKALGLESVAVFSEADRGALHTELADRAICIGPARASDSYLNISALLSTAAGTKCDAVHPGYGFLAERADFAKECANRNLIFVGPSPEAIQAMGDKAAARRTATRFDVPVVPGTEAPPTSSDEAFSEAQRIGFPVLCKASAGGGGKGMRIVRVHSEFNESYEQASSEALAAFGDGTLYLERYLEDIRHIEVQIIGDDYGNVVHLGERDCTVQRRHQKLIEEAPSSNLPPIIRSEILEAALKIAKGIHYRNAGTMEFVLDRKRQEFYFIEMNTRIQVEHPVTEMLTGIDLVAAQLRVAAGERLDFIPGNQLGNGHSIECRINAEDAEKMFQPSPGLITKWQIPEGGSIRVDTHCRMGYRVPPYYDSLLAKVIVHGSTRQEAIEKMREALDNFEIEGVATTLPFHRRILRDQRFIDAQINTKWVEEVFMAGSGT
jgi:acetyl-CoA carboxylase biotin carboxylase subunit